MKHSMFAILNPEIILASWFFLIVALSFIKDGYLPIIGLSLFLMYFLLIIVIHLYLRANYTVSDTERRVPLWRHKRIGIQATAGYVTLAYLFILLPIVAMILIFPSWSIPFSNTIGFLVLQNPMTSLLHKLGYPNVENINKYTDNDDFTKKYMIDGMIRNTSLFVNKLDQDISKNMEQINNILNFVSETEIDENNDDMIKLQDLINKKYKFGNNVWFFFASVLTALALRYHITNTTMT